MDDFDQLLERTSLGAPGAESLIEAVPDRITERALGIAQEERARQEAQIANRLLVGIRAAEAVAVGSRSAVFVSASSSSRAMAKDTQTLDKKLDADLSLAGSRRGRRRPGRTTLEDLAALAGNGDRAALNDLLTRVRAVAHRYVRSRLWTYPGGADMVDDVAQEVCVAVFGALSRYRDEGRPFEAFIYSVAARKVADAQRAFAVAAESPTAEEHADRHSEVQRIMDLLDKLPEKLSEILRLRVVAGMSAEETGRALGMTARAVRVAQHRALNILRGYVAHEGRD